MTSPVDQGDQDERLSSDARSLLAAYARERTPPADRRAHNLDGVLRKLQSDDDSPSIAPTPAVDPRRVRLGVIGLGLALAAAVALWVARDAPRSSWLFSGRAVDQAAMRSSHHDAPQRIAPRRAADGVMSEPPATREATTHAPERRHVAPRRERSIARERTTSEPPPSAVTAADRLERESALIRQARVELDHGRHDAALERLAAHAREFPAGALTEERLAFTAIALCSIGQLDKGRAEARVLLRRNPRSSQRAGVLRACQFSSTDLPNHGE
ncbi:MAG: hypothetical protein KC636_36320 [Myxococcales bacterium]|nr:hypothetical protein [Myxococcales bacterium]